MSRKPKAADRRPKVDIAQTDELGRTRAAQKASIVAWVLSGFVTVAGVVALVLTGKTIFVLFIVLGILTPLNVIAYDNVVLKPKVARLKAEREKQAASEAAVADADRTAPTPDAMGPTEPGGAKETDQ